MARTPRINVGNEIYHVINRANARLTIFKKKEDYQLFEELLLEAKELIGMRILAYCIMPNHFHLVLHPRNDGDVSEFMRWLTVTHTRRLHVQNETIGHGHLYQGRYKAFIVEHDFHFLQLCRYVERNALRANLVKKAEDWQWSSLWRRVKGSEVQKRLLDPWLVTMPKDYLARVTLPETEEELESLRRSVNKGKPYGSDEWTERIVEEYNLESTTRGVGRPKK